MPETGDDSTSDEVEAGASAVDTRVSVSVEVEVWRTTCVSVSAALGFGRAAKTRRGKMHKARADSIVKGERK